MSTATESTCVEVTSAISRARLLGRSRMLLTWLADDSRDVAVDSSMISRCSITLVVATWLLLAGMPKPEIGIRTEIATVQAF